MDIVPETHNNTNDHELDDINHQTDNVANVVTNASACEIFLLSLIFTILISFFGSILIAVGPIISLVSRDPSQMAGLIFPLFAAYWFMLTTYVRFVSSYTRYIFNQQLVKLYNIRRIISRSRCYSICGSCTACFIVNIVFVVTTYFYVKSVVDNLDYDTDTIDIDDTDTNIDTTNDTDNDSDVDKQTNDLVSQLLGRTMDFNNPYYWANAILLSPTWILCITFIVIGIATYYTIQKRIKTNPNLAGTGLLINERHFDLNENWKVNKTLMYKLILIHLLLLFTWILWKWLTASYVSITCHDGTVDFDVNREHPFLSYWFLYLSTTFLKYICIEIGSFNNDEHNILLFESKRIIIMVNILISILFSFGLKNIFSNVKNWPSFIVIAGFNAFLNILVNGSMQSHQYGKRLMNKCKRFINKQCCCGSKRLYVTDFDEMENVLEYNHYLAFNLSVKFLISTCSSLIMMAVFAISMLNFSMIYDELYDMSTDAINTQIFEFLAASFGIECVIFFGQIMAFKKRDRVYFINPKKYTEDMKALMKVSNVSPTRMEYTVYDCVDILVMSLLLAYFWIGNLSGLPADL